MTTLTRKRITVAAAVGLPVGIALWLLTATTAVTSTHVFLALLVISTGFIAYNTWNNGQATSSMAQVIHEAEIAPVTSRNVSTHTGPGSRRDV